jgi:hypothetical protein
MSRAKYNHIHKYRAINSERKMYRCTIEGCPHSISAVLLVKRQAMCPACDTVFTVSEEHLRNQNIACIGCGTKFGAPWKKKPGYVEPIEAPLNVDDILNKVSESLK